MTTTERCPQCGAEIPSDAPQGQCPKCLLQAGYESQSGVAATQDSPTRSAFVPPLPAELQPNFPQYELLELLGKGGMGAVYKARQPGLDRLVAIKILPAEVSQTASFSERFTREARALAKLNHPNIVAVHDFGQAGGLYYFVMEYVGGVNLRQAIQSGKMNPKEALAIVPQICDALQFAHDEGVVHRDIKPENILIDKRGRVKIADFGLAKLLGQETTDHGLTATQQVMGTLRYMAPEQMEGSHDVDHRADIFSLGVVFYELLTGELPIGRFAPPSKKVQIDVRLDDVVLRTLEKEPELRYQHASDVKSAIEQMSLVQQVPQPPAFQAQSTSSVDLLPQLTVTAVGGVLGALLMAAGLGLAAFAMLSEFQASGQFWGWVGAALGCFCGGGGALIGSMNSYRQLTGAGDLMTEPGWNWLDAVLGSYGLFGLAVFLLGMTLTTLDSVARNAMLLLGSITLGQAALFFCLRWPFRRLDKTKQSPVARATTASPRSKTVKVLLSIVTLISVLLLMSSSLSTSPGSSSFELGSPWPWFSIESGPKTFGIRVILLSWEWLIVAVGAAAIYAYVRIEKMEPRTNDRLDRRAGSILAAILIGTPLLLGTWHYLTLARAPTSRGESELSGLDSSAIDRYLQQIGLPTAQQAEVRQIMAGYRQQYLALERRHTRIHRDEQGRVQIDISPFSAECQDLAKRLAEELGGIIDEKYLPKVEVGTLPRELFGMGGESRVHVELWQEGSNYKWREKLSQWADSPKMKRGDSERGGGAGSIQGLPPEYIRYWQAPAADSPSAETK